MIASMVALLTLTHGSVGFSQSFPISDSYFIESPSQRVRLERIADTIVRSSQLEALGRLGARFNESPQFELLRREVGMRMISPSLEYRQPTNLASLSKAIVTQVESVISEQKVDGGQLLREFLIAQGICDWVRTHVLFNQALTPDQTGQYRYSKPTLAKFWTSKTLLQQPTLYAVCAGMTRLTLDLATESGLKCKLVNGFSRQSGNRFASRRDHSWNVFLFKMDNSELVPLPVDITQSLMTLDRARTARSIRRTPFCLPLTKAELGVFAWKEQASELDGGQPLEFGVNYSRLSLDDWKKFGWDNLAGTKEWDLAKESRVAVVNRPVEE